MNSKIVFKPGLNWDTLPVSTSYISLNRDLVIDRIRRCAAEWREACGSQDLHNALTTAGEMITDFATMIGLHQDEIVNILSGQPGTSKDEPAEVEIWELADRLAAL
jgi:hypothetical protein